MGIKCLKFVTILCIISFQLSAAKQGSDEELFDIAREKLAKREINSAISILRPIYVKDRSNGNINFLMGAAYAELKGNEDKAIYHLKKAVKKVSKDYVVGSFEEANAPIHTYYYLTIALAAKDQCSRAAVAAAKLTEYASQIDKYFIEEADRHLQKCPYEEISEDFEEWINNDEVPESYDPLLIDIDTAALVQENPHILANLDSAKKAELGIVTKELVYTTNSPLYGVQIGSGTNPTPISNYSSMKNVDVFVDKEGIIRYVVGHFAYKNQAENLLKRLQAEGYPDAFIVNVNDERKYSNELISYNNVNLRAGLTGSVEYYVQLGAFKDSVPGDLMDLYLEIEGIKELEYNDMTLMTVGPFTTFEAAMSKKEEIFRIDPIELREAFVVAFNRGKKISLEEAKNHTD